ncbi:endonuclease/exonuclease/phosphatase family protein [Aureimonas sp. AU4]|uniref:endonuclease/exonuclease/phosphatase family protein n=1 Tax=Aureimonas sp. AU4 TaxID=1638163 RepID=UPI000781C98B|nr:endonuclease/exonuclease/phosphatase family protein [Aureimonas sp. AU4]
MRPTTRSTALRVARGFVAVLLLLLVVAAFLPEIRSDRWWIRYAEFPHLQFLIATVVLLGLFAAIGGLRPGRGRVIGMAAVVAAAYQATQLLPFTPLAPFEAQGAANCRPERTLRILSANVQAGNRDGEAVLGAIRSVDADVVLLLETDAWWDQQIATLYDRYTHHVASQPRAAHYYGMQVLSRLPLMDPQMLYLFDEATPTLDTRVTLRDGTPVRLIGLHPRPPLSEPQPTTLRDGTIAGMASRATTSTEPVIMAGDFNAVPWSPIVQLAKRVARVEDPRVGRGFIASFNAHSAWMRWPLDHILAQDSFTVLSFDRMGTTGSDHYPMLATLCLNDRDGTRQAKPVAQGDRARVEKAMEAARASK